MGLGKPATGLPRYFMDCGWYRHPHFAGLPVESLFLFEAIVGYSTEHATDGRAPAHPEDLAAVLGVRAAVVRKGLSPLLQRGRLEIDGDEVVMVGFTDHNPSAAEVSAYTASKSKAGALGNHKRWHVERGVVDSTCDLCESQTDRRCDRETSQNGSHGMGWDGITPQSPPKRRSRPPTEAELQAESRARSEAAIAKTTQERIEREREAADAVPPPPSVYATLANATPPANGHGLGGK